MAKAKNKTTHKGNPRIVLTLTVVEAQFLCGAMVDIYDWSEHPMGHLAAHIYDAFMLAGIGPAQTTSSSFTILTRGPK